MVWSVAWSTDTRFLASGSADHTIRIWSVSSGNCVRQLQGHTDWVVTVTWSPHDRYLASLGNDHTIRVWNTRSWEMIRCWSVHGSASYLKDLVWSPDGRLLASAARDRVISVWKPSTGRELARFTFPEDSAWRLAWSPDGAFLVSSHSGDIFRVWDTRELMSVSVTALSSPSGHLVQGLVELPAALSQLHRLQLYPPLSLLHELLRLLSGHGLNGVLAQLAEFPTIRKLVALKWPTRACVGLAALLLRPLSSPAWKPPPELTPSSLQERLITILAEEPMEPQASAPPLTALIEAANSIDERLLNLLVILGPEAIADDPGLPLRLLHRVPEIPCLSVPQRRLLGLRLPLQRSGRVHGHGRGSEWAGLALRGDLRTLLLSQLVLPRPMLQSREWRGELLYRARTGQEPPRLRTLVLVLDISPSCYGSLEITLRLTAHILAASLIKARLSAILVTAGGASRVRALERSDDLLELWTARTLSPADASGALRVARSLQENLRDGVLEPFILVLSHPWFGANETLSAHSLRGLFVQYPGQRVKPALADYCERWDSIAAGDLVQLVERLSRLVA
jgi:ATP-dependent Clp protease ATP-binding subunit ClpC